MWYYPACVQERGSWRASELSKLMDLAPAKLRMAAIFWINQGRVSHLLLLHNQPAPQICRKDVNLGCMHVACNSSRAPVS